MAKFLILAGHGGTDPGNTANGRKEAALMLELRNIVAHYLYAAGHDVMIDGANRTENQALSVIIGTMKRLKLALTGRLAVELHTNAAANTQAQGVEVIAHAHHRQIAQALAGNIAQVLGTTKRRTAGWFDYAVLKKEQKRTLGFLEQGGLIVETFFQSNPRELAAYDAKKWLVGKAIAGVLMERHR